jgi:hypothetical protein
MADLPGGASGMLVRGYKGKEADRLVTRIDPPWSPWSLNSAAASGRPPRNPDSGRPAARRPHGEIGYCAPALRPGGRPFSSWAGASGFRPHLGTEDRCAPPCRVVVYCVYHWIVPIWYKLAAAWCLAFSVARAQTPILAGAQQLVHILSGAYGVVPAPEHFVGNEVELTHFRV